MLVAKLNLRVDDSDVDGPVVPVFRRVEHAGEHSADIAKKELGQRASLAACRAITGVFNAYIERTPRVRHVGCGVLAAEVAVANPGLVTVRSL